VSGKWQLAKSIYKSTRDNLPGRLENSSRIVWIWNLKI